MPTAPGTVHFGPHREHRLIDAGANRRVDRTEEARPAGAAVELGCGVEERLRAAGADKGAHPLLVVERAGEGAFGAVAAQHAVLLRGELIAPGRVGLLQRERRRRVRTGW